MGRKEFIKLISLYLDNRLDPETRAKFDEKLKSDLSLRSEVAAQRRIKSYLQHFPKVEILNDNFKKHLLHRVEREVIPPKRNYRLNYATVTLALILVSFLMGGTAFGVKWAVEELNKTERYIVQVDAAASRSAESGELSVNPALGANASERIEFDVVGVAPEDFFTEVLTSYQSGEVVREVVAPFFNQTNIFEGATVSPPESSILNGKAPWVKYTRSLPTEVHIIIPRSLEPSFRDFMNRQKGVSPATAFLENINDISESDADEPGSEHIWVDIRFSSYRETG
ncbi:zf-HC2 domain-containing protein [bacterium]|nr:zf-HC2 domain-containing protein [bacterium]